jgi:hypothetical protein
MVFIKDLYPDFSRARAVQEQGISAQRRSVLLQGLNNAVPVPLWLAFGEEHQMPFFIFCTITVCNSELEIN